MTNVTYNINSLSPEELKIILESLLFSSSASVCSDWYKENTNISFDIAKKIRQMFPEIIVDNVYIHENKNKPVLDEYSDELIKYFPEIEKKSCEF
jgi:hypothetical protein